MGIGDPDAQQLHAAGPPVGAIALKLVEAIVGGGAGHERLSVEVSIFYQSSAQLLRTQWISGTHAESDDCRLPCRLPLRSFGGFGWWLYGLYGFGTRGAGGVARMGL